MKYGPENSNYRHGKYSSFNDVSDYRISLLKDRLDKTLSAPIETLSGDDQRFCWNVLQNRPWWARDILRSHGIKDLAEG